MKKYLFGLVLAMTVFCLHAQPTHNDTLAANTVENISNITEAAQPLLDHVNFGTATDFKDSLTAVLVNAPHDSATQDIVKQTSAIVTYWQENKGKLNISWLILAIVVLIASLLGWLAKHFHLKIFGSSAIILIVMSLTVASYTPLNPLNKAMTHTIQHGTKVAQASIPEGMASALNGLKMACFSCAVSCPCGMVADLPVNRLRVTSPLAMQGSKYISERTYGKSIKVKNKAGKPVVKEVIVMDKIPQEPTA